MTISHNNIITSIEDDFVDHRILSYEEIFFFDDNDIESLKTVGSFSNEVVFKPFDLKHQPDFASSSWVCFLGYPYGLGLEYPF